MSIESAAGVPECYQLVVGSLTMRSGAAGTDRPGAWKPPSRIRVSTEAPSAAERDAHYVDGALTVRPHGVPAGSPLFELGEWTRLQDGTVEISWNGGFSGVFIEAKRRDVDWVGRLTVRTDEVGPPRPSAPVTMKPYPCRQADPGR